jgi:hypothetical protein
MVYAWYAAAALTCCCCCCCCCSFDELLLLKRGGRTIFHGPLGTDSTKLIDYFMQTPGERQGGGVQPQLTTSSTSVWSKHHLITARCWLAMHWQAVHD